ncbi:hypothetical protein VTP01DRAFT_8302 [Rhizomucor pusillus]|uniref:uncharacterized protein n=1 Tax=Rhizomucor pusillus TaxID=4840 RepID=UPI0037438C52
MQALVVLTIFALHILLSSAVAAQQQLQQLQIPIQSSKGDPDLLPSPFTVEWVQLLEQFYNTFGGHRNASREEDECPVEIPEFACDAFYWHDALDRQRSARHLRPQDIRSVIALGDSISAGFGMLSGRPPFATIWEYRGKVFSVGMDIDEYTLPNFLARYTDTEGGPDGVTFPLSRGKGLDLAVSGAKVQDLNNEVDKLIYLLNSDKQYRSIKDEWKLITIFIGANNICVLCEKSWTGRSAMAQAEEFERHMQLVLEKLRDNVSKSFVNLVALFNVSSVYEAALGDPYCEFVLNPNHLHICSCLQGDSEQRLAADLMVAEYNMRLEKLAHNSSLLTHDFYIAYQPGFTAFPVSKYKQGYLSSFDCFHPNKCANKVMAMTLWNNMFSSPAEKLEPYDIENLTFKCPGPDRPYLQ